MFLSDRARKIIDAGFGAYYRTKVRPDPGHTELRKGVEGYQRTFSVACVVGAMAHEARVLMGKGPHRSDEASVAAYFEVDIDEVRMIEGGFDSYFHVQNGEYDFDSDEDAMEIMGDLEYCNCEECLEVRGQQTADPKVNIPELFVEKILPQKSEFWQVGWAVAKKATEHYTKLDESEEEAWKMYEERGFANKNWLDIQLEDYRVLFSRPVELLR